MKFFISGPFPMVTEAEGPAAATAGVDIAAARRQTAEVRKGGPETFMHAAVGLIA